MPKPLDHLAKEFVNELYEEAVHQLLDDPWFIYDPESGRSAVKWLTMYMVTASELGLDFWKLIVELGSEAELDTLRGIFLDHNLPWRA